MSEKGERFGRDISDIGGGGAAKGSEWPQKIDSRRDRRITRLLLPLSIQEIDECGDLDV